MGYVLDFWTPVLSYRVISKKSGAIVFETHATSPAVALDEMAQAAGYADFKAACMDSGDDGSHLTVEEF